MIDSCHSLGLGHGSRVMRVAGQLNDGSRVSRVTKCDPLSALVRVRMVPYSGTAWYCTAVPYGTVQYRALSERAFITCRWFSDRRTRWSEWTLRCLEEVRSSAVAPARSSNYCPLWRRIPRREKSCSRHSRVRKTHQKWLEFWVRPCVINTRVSTSQSNR